VAARHASAPVLVVCLSDKDAYLDRYAARDKGWTDRDEARWPVPYWDVDTGMAALLVLLTAVDAGLGGCFFGVPPERFDALRAAFDIPAGRTPVGVVSVGYPAPDRRSPSLRRGRRPLAEVAHEGRFGVPYRA
jgi:nitroreductase